MTSFVFKIQANMDPNHRDRIAFVRVCSGKLERGMKAKLVRTGKPMSLSAPQFFFARIAHHRRRGLCRRRRRHPQPRHAAHRRHADRGRGDPVPRRAELRAGNPAPRPPRRRDEGQEAEGGAAPDGRGRRRPAVLAGRRLAGDRRRRRRAAARRAQGAAATSNTRCRSISRCRASRSAAGSIADDPADLQRFVDSASRRHRPRPRRRSGVPGAARVLAATTRPSAGR